MISLYFGVSFGKRSSNIQATAEATKTAEQLMAEKVAEVVGADFKFRKL